jgi:hypothetical protein
MCACIPFTKPILISFISWVRRMRGLGSTHYSCTTASGYVKKENDWTITKVVECHIQLLPVSKIPTAQNGVQDGNDAPADWQSIGPYGVKTCCESNARRKPRIPGPVKWKK